MAWVPQLRHIAARKDGAQSSPSGDPSGYADVDRAEPRGFGQHPQQSRRQEPYPIAAEVQPTELEVAAASSLAFDDGEAWGWAPCLSNRVGSAGATGSRPGVGSSSEEPRGRGRGGGRQARQEGSSEENVGQDRGRGRGRGPKASQGGSREHDGGRAVVAAVAAAVGNGHGRGGRGRGEPEANRDSSGRGKGKVEEHSAVPNEYRGGRGRGRGRGTSSEEQDADRDNSSKQQRDAGGKQQAVKADRRKELTNEATANGDYAAKNDHGTSFYDSNRTWHGTSGAGRWQEAVGTANTGSKPAGGGKAGGKAPERQAGGKSAEHQAAEQPGSQKPGQSMAKEQQSARGAAPKQERPQPAPSQEDSQRQKGAAGSRGGRDVKRSWQPVQQPKTSEPDLPAKSVLADDLSHSPREQRGKGKGRGRGGRDGASKEAQASPAAAVTSDRYASGGRGRRGGKGGGAVRWQPVGGTD